MQLYGRKKKRMVQAWMIDTSEEDQRTPHHRNPPQYISLEDLQKLGVLFYKVRYTRQPPRQKLIEYSHSKACCRGRTSWSQTTQGNGILINESCDIASTPFYIYSPKDQRISQTEYNVTTVAQVCKSLGRTGSYESMQ